MGWSDAEKVAWNLNNAIRAIPTLEGRLAAACGALGDANRVRGPMRRHWQAKAMRSINAAPRSSACRP
jgi:hypothetical protein